MENDNIFEDPDMRDAIFPPSIRPAPYDGVIEGGLWIAIPSMAGDPLDSPFYSALWGDIVESSNWWANEENELRIGVGDTPDDALYDLIGKTWFVVLGHENDDDEEYEGPTIEELEEIHVEHMSEVIDDLFSLIGMEIEAQESETPEDEFINPALMNRIEMTDLIEEEWEDKGYSSAFQMFTPVFLTLAYTCLKEMGKDKNMTPREVLASMQKSRTKPKGLES